MGPPFSPDGLDDLPKSVSGKTGVGVTFCHMLENHDPCDNMFWPLDQTDMALDTLDGLLEVSRGSVMWLATQGVVPARWARRHHLGMAPARWAQRTPLGLAPATLVALCGTRCGGLPSRWVLFALFPVISYIQINFYVHVELGE